MKKEIGALRFRAGMFRLCFERHIGHATLNRGNLDNAGGPAYIWFSRRLYMTRVTMPHCLRMF